MAEALVKTIAHAAVDAYKKAPLWQKLIGAAGAAMVLSLTSNTLLSSWEKRRPRYKLVKVQVPERTGESPSYSVTLHVKEMHASHTAPTIGS
jgi:hypothetical protein